MCNKELVEMTYARNAESTKIVNSDSFVIQENLKLIIANSMTIAVQKQKNVSCK